MPYNKSFIDQGSSVKMAGYWIFFMDLDFVSFHKNAKRELGQYPAVLTSRLVNKYILLDGLSYNTRGYFASCVVFFRAPQGEQWAKCPRVLYVKPSNKRFIIPLQKGVILMQFYLVRVFLKKCIIRPSERLRTMYKQHRKSAKLINILYLIV